MSRAPIRPGLVFPLIAEKIGPFDRLKLVDMGCGNGNLIRHFQDMEFAEWVGVDSGKAIIESAVANTDDLRVKYIHDDLTNSLPLVEKSFDVVTSIFVIEEVPYNDFPSMFLAIFKLLKPEGQAIIFCNHPANAMIEDLESVREKRPNKKFANQKGYFDRNKTSYALSVLNQEQNLPLMADYHHKTLGDIINAAAKSDLMVTECGEIPNGIISLSDWKNHTPRQGDIPRFLYLLLKPVR